MPDSERKHYHLMAEKIQKRLNLDESAEESQGTLRCANEAASMAARNKRVVVYVCGWVACAALLDSVDLLSAHVMREHITAHQTHVSCDTHITATRSPTCIGLSTPVLWYSNPRSLVLQPPFSGLPTPVLWYSNPRSLVLQPPFSGFPTPVF